jgi:hypothetical protein
MASVPFNNLITFSRGSNATLTGSNGLIQWAPNNLLTFSEQFDNAAWQKFGGGVATAPAVTANAGIAPDGTTTADRVQFALNGGATSTDRSLLSQSATLATSFPYTYSIWVRSLSGTLSMGIGCDNLVGNTPITVTTTWQRFTVSGTATGTAGVALLQLRGGQAPTQSNAADVFVWGAQLEIGSTATTYNSTTVKNLLGFSEAFDNAAWNKNNASIVTGAQANPVNGAFNAQKLMEDTSTNLHRVSQVPTLTAAAHTASIYAKSAGRNWLYMANASLSQAAYFNLNTGTIGTIVGAATATITSVGNGWYRCSITSTPSAGAQNYSFYTANADASFSYTGDGNSGIYIYGAQLSDSASLDPYVPTPGAAPSSTAYYGPRFDYDPVTLAPKGILIEEQRVNRTLQSENFTVSPWAAAVSGTSTRVNTNTSLGFMRGTITATSALGGIRQSYSGLTSAQVYALSFYVQSSSTSLIVTLENGSAAFGSAHTVTLNPSNGTAGTPTGYTSVTSTPFGSGYVYTLITAAAGGTLIANFEWRFTNNGDSMLYGRPQFEAGSFATSYIPTVASQVTRTADQCSIVAPMFAPWYNQSEGTFVAAFDSYLVDLNTRSALSAYASGATSNNILLINTQQRQFQINNAGNQADLDGGTPTSGTVTQVAGAYRVNDFALSLNGGTVVTDTSGTVPTVDTLGIGISSLGLTPVNGHIRSIQFYPVRLADFQLQAITA